MKIRANIYAITDIDNERQEFTANLKIRARWKEPLMQGKQLHNRRSDLLVANHGKPVIVRSQGLYVLSPRPVEQLSGSVQRLADC